MKVVYCNLFSSNKLSLAMPILLTFLEQQAEVRIVNADPYVTQDDKNCLLEAGVAPVEGNNPFIERLKNKSFMHEALRERQRRPMAKIVSDADVLFCPREGNSRQDGLMRDIVKLAHEHSKRLSSFILQHGVIPEDAIREQIYFPFTSDWLLLWSNYYYEWLAKRGMPEEYLRKAVVTGCPKFDQLVNLTKKPQYIVVITNGHWSRYTDEQNTAFLGSVKSLCEAFPNERIIWKTHPAERHFGQTSQYEAFIAKHDLHIELQQDNISIPGLLAGAKLVVHTCSTVALEAMIANVPVLTVNYTDMPTGLDLFGATYYTDRKDNVLHLAERAMTHPDEKTEQRLRLAQLHNGVCDGKATERVVELMSAPEATGLERYKPMYDAYWSNWHQGVTDFLPNTFIDKVVDVFRPRFLLDAGCGPGGNLRRFLEHNVDAHGIEYSGWMVNNRLSDLRIKNRVQEGSVTDIPYAADTFDVVYCIEVLEHISMFAIYRAIRELIRVCRGSIICTIATTPSAALDGPDAKIKRTTFAELKVHATVQPIHWWLQAFRECGAVYDTALSRALAYSEKCFDTTHLCVFHVLPSLVQE